MAYPSLLFRDPSLIAAPLYVPVVDDLRLREAMTSVADDPAIGASCRKEDILLRQEAVRELLSDPAKRARIGELYAVIGEMKRADALYQAGKNAFEKNVILLFLCRTLASFVHKAAALQIGGELFGRFSSYFASQEALSRFSAMEADAEALFTDGGETRFRLQYEQIGKGEPSVVLYGGEAEPYIDRLQKCADALGYPYEERPFACDPDRALGDALCELFADRAAQLEAFAAKHRNLYVDTVLAYGGQLCFYTDILRMVDLWKENGIPYCFAAVSDDDISVREAYDVTLLYHRTKEIVPNDISFTRAENFFFLTGANGGGKTTYLRTVGLCVQLALWGAPLPCRFASIPALNGVFTHFPADERFLGGDGRYSDEERRVEDLLAKAAYPSLILLNETFSTTTESKASASTAALAQRVAASGSFGLYVTHQHEMSGGELPTLCAQIDEEDGNRRTFRILRQGATDRSFALDILKKYALSEEDLLARFPDGKGDVK